jgi:ABC-type uncharacterized transport system permease subunit
MHRSEFGHHSVHRPFKSHLTLDYGSADCPLVGCFWNTVASNFGMGPLFFSFIRVHLRMVLIQTLVKRCCGFCGRLYGIVLLPNFWMILNWNAAFI